MNSLEGFIWRPIQLAKRKPIEYYIDKSGCHRKLHYASGTYQKLYEYQANLVRIIDADTLILEVDVGFHIKVEERFRLLGVDAPEKGEDGYEQANAFVYNSLKDKDLIINTQKQDGFRRWLVDVFYFENDRLISLAKELIVRGLAIKWEGKN